jgi:hypothetical protein
MSKSTTISLRSLSQKPKLVEIILDDQETLDVFGSPVSFFTYDRQPLHVYLEISQAFGKNAARTEELLSGLLFNEDATPLISEGEMPDATLMAKALTKVMEQLGKSQPAAQLTSSKKTPS